MAMRRLLVRSGGQTAQLIAGDTLASIKMAQAIDEAVIGTIASAGSLVMPPNGPNTYFVTGTSSVQNFSSGIGNTLGNVRRLIFTESGGTIIHIPSFLNLPTAADIVWGAGDVATFQATSAGAQWRCIGYQRADGKSLVSQAGPSSTDGLTEGTTNLYFTEQRVRTTTLAGLATGANAPIAATDKVIAAFANLQAQITALGKAFRVETVMATAAGQTAFTIPNGYAPGNILVWLNGVLLGSDDYTATTSPTVTLAVGATSTQDVLQVGVLSAIRAQDDALLQSTVANLPAAGTSLAKIRYCTNMAGRAGPVYSDGTNWRRFVDDSVVTT